MHALRPEQRQRLVRYMTLLLSIILCAVTSAVTPIADPPKGPEPYYTSILSGEGWVLELLTGHPERIRNELGMHAELFNELITALRSYGHTNSRLVSLEEQLAIFLYTCVTGLPAEHVGERFQRPKDAITRYFCKMVSILSSPPFYTSVITPPNIIMPVPSKMRSNRKFWPYFGDVIGAIDCIHVPIAPPPYIASSFRNRKGLLSHKCLFACNFDLHFTYVLTGWEGCASDTQVYDSARTRALKIPDGKYILGDLGFPSDPSLLAPYRDVRYHLAEWDCVRPENKQELFNLRHASARNVIKRTFGALKNRFRILLLPLPYSIEIQARIPQALCAIHNYIRSHQPNEDNDVSDDDLEDTSDDEFAPEAEKGGTGELRDTIAQAMWDDYLKIRRARGLDNLDDSDSELDA